MWAKEKRNKKHGKNFCSELSWRRNDPMCFTMGTETVWSSSSALPCYMNTRHLYSGRDGDSNNSCLFCVKQRHLWSFFGCVYKLIIITKLSTCLFCRQKWDFCKIVWPVGNYINIYVGNICFRWYADYNNQIQYTIVLSSKMKHLWRLMFWG